MRKNILIMLVSLLTISCSKLPMLKSVYIKDIKDNVPTSGHDNNGKIQWAIANDNKNLYFKFETANKSIIPMIMRNGFIIYLDTTMHKKKSVYFEIKNRTDEDDSRTLAPNQKGELGKKFMKRNINGSFKDGYWKNIGDEEYFDLQFDNTYFAAVYQVDSFGTLICKVTIPLSFIKKSGLSAIDKMSIGLKVEPAKRPSMKGVNRPDSGEDMDEGGMKIGGGSPEGVLPEKCQVVACTEGTVVEECQVKRIVLQVPLKFGF